MNGVTVILVEQMKGFPLISQKVRKSNMKPDAAKGQHNTVANRRLLCEAFTCLNLIDLQDRHKNYDPARKLYMITVCVCTCMHVSL